MSVPLAWRARDSLELELQHRSDICGRLSASQPAGLEFANNLPVEPGCNVALKDGLQDQQNSCCVGCR
jgi:hypothetical protein